MPQANSARPAPVRWTRLILLAGFFLLAMPAVSMAWGGATHIELGERVMNQLALLPAGVAAVLSRHRWSYLYGNIAADIVLAKKMTRVKQVCHHWATAFKLLQESQSDAEQSFSYGYMSHLAADTVAHNKFLPHQLLMSRATLSFGHLYWELRADAHASRESWATLRDALDRPFPLESEMLRRHIRDTLLPFGANYRAFLGMNRVASQGAWRRSIENWARLSRWPLAGDLIKGYQDESFARIMDVLQRGQQSTVLSFDPNGNSALEAVRAQRRQLRQMRRAGLPVEHVLTEASGLHAPQPLWTPG